MRPWEYWSMDAYDYHLITDLVAEFRDALETERRAEAKAAQMRGKG